MIKAIIFDFGGVIVKSTSDVRFQNIGRAFGMTSDKVYEIYKDLKPKLYCDEITLMDVMLEMSIASGNEVPDDYEEMFLESCGVRGFYSTKDIVRKLKDKYRVACISNISRVTAEYYMKEKQFEVFDNVFFSCDLGCVKPSKEIFSKALSVMELDANEVIFIDDKEINLPEAREMGIDCIVFESEEKLEKELKKRKIISSF